MKALKIVSALVLACLMACPVLAAEAKKEAAKAKKPAQKCPAMVQAEQMLKGVTLDAEQKAKLGEVTKEFGPKLVVLQKDLQATLNPEQKTAAAAANKAALAAGKKPDWKAIEESLKLTDEQKAQRAEIRKEQAAIIKEMREKVRGLLTPEQKEQLKKAQPPAKK